MCRTRQADESINQVPRIGTTEVLRVLEHLPQVSNTVPGILAFNEISCLFPRQFHRRKNVADMFSGPENPSRYSIFNLRFESEVISPGCCCLFPNARFPRIKMSSQSSAEES